MNIILSILAGFAYGVTAWMAISAYFTLRRLVKDVRTLIVVNEKTRMLLQSLIIKQNLEEITKLRKMQLACVEHEDFETAQRLKETLEAQEKNVNESIDAFNREFGDMVEIQIQKIR